MIKTCPFFNICGGCKYDFAAPDYQQNKLSDLPKIKYTDNAIWGIPGTRRRADFSFDNGHFGFFKKHSKDIVDINKCANVLPEINAVLPEIAKLPWSGAGSVLITKCENGIDIAVTSTVPFFGNEFKLAVEKLPSSIIRFTWNDKTIRKYMDPEIKFNDKIIKYPTNAFLQPTTETEQALRDMVVKYVNDADKVADLFCGLGNFTFATNATGFDIVGNGIKRDLFKRPLTIAQLNQYDVVIMDPPRNGAEKQSKELSKSDVKRIIYVSCNPTTFIRDKKILETGGYKQTVAIPVDQFVGASHWEIFGVFEK